MHTLAAFHPRLAAALENNKARFEYAREVNDIVGSAAPGYKYECGAVTNPDKSGRILPEILRFSWPR